MSKVIAIHVHHDANVCICVGGELIVVLELERYFEQRYFCSSSKRVLFVQQWKQAIEQVQKFSGIKAFDIAVTSWVMPSQLITLQTLIKADRWVKVDHHVSHASIGFYDSPFNNALVLSYDGGGNDGTFNVYHGNIDNGLKHIERIDLNLGKPYRMLGVMMPEITREKFNPEMVSPPVHYFPQAFAGKVMGYAALGVVQPEWIQAFREYYEHFINSLCSFFQLGDRIGLTMEQNALDEKNARDVAATSQHVFTQLACEQAKTFLARYLGDEDNPKLDGLVLTGGCALNVHTNQIIASTFGYPVHVAPAPSDCGISVGAAWNVVPPSRTLKIQYSGMPLFDGNMLQHFVNLRKAKNVTVAEVAELLVGGAVIGVVKGRQEFGPRALGHRSVLGYPNEADMKERINKLKNREWFRPLCPSITVECAPRLVVGHSFAKDKSSSPLCLYGNGNWTPASTYMSFAPQLTEEAKKLFPAITHFDGTARYQTVSKDDAPWYHSLLVEVGKRTGGYEILLNTSFNEKGKPILNRIKTALGILDSAPQGHMDYVLIEDWLFSPKIQNI